MKSSCGHRRLALIGSLIALMLTPFSATLGSQALPEGELIGVLICRKEVLLRAGIAERVKGVDVALGDRVLEGATIARLDDRALRLKVSEAQAQIQSALAEVQAARSESLVAWRRYDVRMRMPEMWSGDEIARTRLEFEQAVARKAVADSRAVLARAAAARCRLELEATRIVAPFSGWVAGCYAPAGQQIEAGEPIARIVGEGELWVRFAVPTSLEGAARPPALVKVLLPKVNVPIAGVVRYLSPEIDAASGMVIAEAVLTAPGSLRQFTRPGAAVRVRL